MVRNVCIVPNLIRVFYPKSAIVYGYLVISVIMWLSLSPILSVFFPRFYSLCPSSIVSSKFLKCRILSPFASVLVLTSSLFLAFDTLFKRCYKTECGYGAAHQTKPNYGPKNIKKTVCFPFKQWVLRGKQVLPKKIFNCSSN